MTMTSDSYSLRLDEMIQLFQEYKSGSVSLVNITKLCQTLGLESFIDDIDAETSRLSTASKIMVIDIDFSKTVGRVKDVKLVLASNFDNFNYFNESVIQTSSKEGNNNNDNANSNILLNSLTKYPDLHQFHHNLKFLHLLDTFSSINIDANNNGGGNVFNGELDLFKYFTELTQFLRQYFADQCAPFKVVTNLGDRFGIYILTAVDRVLLAKISFERSKDTQQRLYEYVYYEGNKEWINESPESFTVGVSMVMEINDKGTSQAWFPREYIPKELVLDENEPTPNDFMNCNSSNSSRCKFHVINDFTSQLVPLRKFDVGNDNMELIFEILKWIQWSRIILYPIYKTLNAKENNKECTEDANFLQNRDGGISTEHTRRRYSNKNKHPSMTEAAMLREEGLQQFNLQELMTDQGAADQEEDGQDLRGEDNSGLLENDEMQIDDQAIEDEHDVSFQLVLSEDHVSLENIAHCTFYDDMGKWDSFMKTFRAQTM